MTMSDGVDVVVTSVTVVERVARIVIERPARRNAVDGAVFDGLVGHACAAAMFVGPGAIGAAVGGGGGSGGQQLSVGRDLADLAALTMTPVTLAGVARVQTVFTVSDELDVPVLGTIDGACLRAGD